MTKKNVVDNFINMNNGYLKKIYYIKIFKYG